MTNKTFLDVSNQNQFPNPIDDKALAWIDGRCEVHCGFRTIFAHSSVLDEAVDNDSVMRRIEYRVARLGRKYCLSIEDRQDIRQEFYLAMFRAGEKYDPERCPPDRFVRMVLNRNYKHFVRKLARADENRARSVDTMRFDDVELDLMYYILDPRGEDDLRLVDLREDVRTVMKSLPVELRDICLELMLDSPFEVARRRGIHHSAIYRALAKLREHFAHAGIEGIY